MTTWNAAPRRRTDRGGAWRRDDGISTLEYLGIVIVAVLLVGAVLVVTLVYPEKLSYAFCRLEAAATGGTASCAVPQDVTADDGPTDEDLRPKACMLNQISEKESGGVKVAFVDLGLDWGLTTETYSDRTVKVTVTNGGGAGVSAGAGGTAGGVGGKVEASAGLDLSFGDSWIYPEDEWPAAEQQMRDYLGQSRWRWLGAGNLWGAEAPRPPDVSTKELGVDVGVSGELSARAPIEGAEDYSLGLGSVSAQAGAGRSLTLETNNVTGERTWVHQGELSAGAQANVLGLGANGEAGVKAAFRVTRDEDDELVSIRFQTTTERGGGNSLGQGVKYTEPGAMGAPSTGSSSASLGYKEGDTQVVVTTTQLTVDDSNRRMVEDWLAERHGGATMGLPFDEVIPDTASDDAMRQLLYEAAVTSRTVYDAESSKTSVGGSVSWGVGFGIEGSSSDSSREVADAQFLGAPDQSGARPFLPDAMCR